MIAYEEAVRLRDLLGEQYGDRLESLKRLREYWHGNFWDQPDSKGGFLSIFNDTSSATGPDVKLVRNFVQQICVKFQTYLSPLPTVTVPIDPPGKRLNRLRAVLKERAIYGLWEDGNMAHSQTKLGWYLPLMGDAFLGCWPDFDRSIVRPLVRSPEYAYPVPGFDVTNPCALDAVIFCWKTDAENAKRSFPRWTPRPKEQQGWMRLSRKHRDSGEVEIMEWSDTRSFVRWVDGQQVNGIQHNLGFNLFDQVQFIHVPDEVHGHGAVEQIVNLNELHNATLSLLWQAIYENVYPTLVLIDPAKAPEQIQRGPGAVVPINAGGDVKWLHPPTQALPNHMGFLNEMERSMKEEAAMPEINFGKSPASSIVTGKAVNELLGAGTGSTIEMVQGSGIGQALTSWNSKALSMLKRMFGEDTIKLGAPVPGTMFDLAPKVHMMSFKGNQIVGSLRNRVTFSPSIDAHTKMVMQLQALGGGLVSKRYGREQIGIPDSEAMEEEILGEMLMDGVMRGLLVQMEQGLEPEQADELEAKGLGYISGEPLGPSGPPLPPMPGQVDLAALMQGSPAEGAPPVPGMEGGGLPPDLMAALGMGGGPPGELPPGGAAPEGEALVPAQPGAGENESVSLDQAIQWFSALPQSQGRIFLVGEIVSLGAALQVEVALTDLADRQPVTEALPQLAGRIRFSRVGAEPDEPFVEVTPGREIRFGGTEPDLAGLLG